MAIGIGDNFPGGIVWGAIGIGGNSLGGMVLGAISWGVIVRGAIVQGRNCPRAHIEEVKGLDTDIFINALVKFFNRRGITERITSDSGTIFKGTVSELNLNSAKVNESAVKDGIA